MTNTSGKPLGTEERILEAAKKVFIQNGLNGARMQDIADKAGINKALLHYYFRSKEMLFDKVFEEAFLNYLSNMTAWHMESFSLQEKLFAYIDHYIDFLAEYPLVPLFIIKELSTNPELFKEKIKAAKGNSDHPKMIDLLREELPKLNSEIDPETFWMNLQSLCSYPFIGAPVFKMGMDLDENGLAILQSTKLKESVRRFISTTLS